jgi:hypothetical protein
VEAKQLGCYSHRVYFSTINIIPLRVNETLIRVKINKFGDITCAKYKSVTPRLSIDGVRATPKQVKVVSLKEKKRVLPSVLENNEKHQRPTIAMLHDKIKTLTDMATLCSLG